MKLSFGIAGVLYVFTLIGLIFYHGTYPSIKAYCQRRHESKSKELTPNFEEVLSTINPHFSPLSHLQQQEPISHRKQQFSLAPHLPMSNSQLPISPLMKSFKNQAQTQLNSILISSSTINSPSSTFALSILHPQIASPPPPPQISKSSSLTLTSPLKTEAQNKSSSIIESRTPINLDLLNLNDTVSYLLPSPHLHLFDVDPESLERTVIPEENPNDLLLHQFIPYNRSALVYNDTEKDSGLVTVFGPIRVPSNSTHNYLASSSSSLESRCESISKINQHKSLLPTSTSLQSLCNHLKSLVIPSDPVTQKSQQTPPPSPSSKVTVTTERSLNSSSSTFRRRQNQDDNRKDFLQN